MGSDSDREPRAGMNDRVEVSVVEVVEERLEVRSQRGTTHRDQIGALTC